MHERKLLRQEAGFDNAYCLGIILETENSVKQLVQPRISRAALKRLKRARLVAGYDLLELSYRTAFSLSLIEKISSGHKRPSRRAIERIESVLSARIFSTVAEYRSRQETEDARAPLPPTQGRREFFPPHEIQAVPALPAASFVN